MSDFFDLIDDTIRKWEQDRGGVVVGDRAALVALVTLAAVGEFEDVLIGAQAAITHQLDQHNAALAEAAMRRG